MDAIVELSTNWNGLFFGLFLLLAAAIALYARAIPQGGTRWWLLAGLTAALTGVGTLVNAGWGKTILIDAAALVAVGLIFVDPNPQARRAAKVYLGMTAAAILCLLAAEFLAETETPTLAGQKILVCLLLVGFALKLALLPLYFWLPGVAQNAAPMSVAVIVSMVDIAALTELVHFRQILPWVFSDYSGLWMAVALLSMFGGAFLALGQNNLRRMLAFSTIDDMGYLLLGVIAGTEIGLNGALLGAAAHAIFKVILFGAVGAAEYRLGHALTLADHGLAGRFPRSGAAFIIAALGMIGVPPLLGFAGRWRLYLAGLEFGGLWLGILMALATILALLYYVRAVHCVWMGPSDGDPVAEAEPRLAGWALISLVILALAMGLAPAWLLSL